MPNTPQDLLRSLMSSIDDIKEKVNDGEYLNMCNLIKALNESINTNNTTNTNYTIENNNGEQETNEDIEELIGEFFLDNYYSHNEEDKQNINMLELLENFNQYIKNICEEYEESGDSSNWFICPCGSCINTDFILDHLNDEYHTNNFHNYIDDNVINRNNSDNN